MSDSLLGTALAFAKRGYAVLPVNWPVERDGKLFCSCGSDLRGRPCGKNSAKHPHGLLVPNGRLGATCESGTIKMWFGYRAPLANLGVRTDGLIVLDGDDRHGGLDSLRALEREHELPPTWRAISGSGSEHVYLREPDAVQINTIIAENVKPPRLPPLGPGIDIIARGLGYIIAPPSQHISGRYYEWSVDHHPRDVELAIAPDWLVAKLIDFQNVDREPPPTGPGSGPERSNNATGHFPRSDFDGRDFVQVITEYRDQALGRVAGHFFAHGTDYHLTLAALRGWNSLYLSPPLGWHEVQRIADRIALRQAKKWEAEARGLQQQEAALRQQEQAIQQQDQTIARVDEELARCGPEPT